MTRVWTILLLLLLLGGVSNAFWLGRVSHKSGGVTTHPSGPPAYVTAVQTDAPTYYWRMTEASGTVATDSADSNTGTYIGGVTLGNAGAARAAPDTAASFNGTTGRVQTTTSLVNPGSTGYSIEAFVNAAAGCPIVQFNTSQTINGGNNDDFDRQLYLGTDGKVYFGQFTGVAVVQVISPGVETGAFHHLVGQYDGAKLSLYVDGMIVAGPTAVGAPQNFTGFWSVGAGEQNSGWPNSGGGANNTTFWCNGKIQETAIYGPGLPAARIYFHATGTNPTLTSISVTPNPATIYGLGNTLQFAATGMWSNNSTTDVTSNCMWASANTSIATINSAGLATSVANGGPINITCTDP